MGRALIVHPPADGRGKYHDASLAETARCGAPVVLDMDPMQTIHVAPDDHDPHPLVCRRCLWRHVETMLRGDHALFPDDAGHTLVRHEGAEAMLLYVRPAARRAKIRQAGRHHWVSLDDLERV